MHYKAAEERLHAVRLEQARLAHREIVMRYYAKFRGRSVYERRALKHDLDKVDSIFSGGPLPKKFGPSDLPCVPTEKAFFYGGSASWASYWALTFHDEPMLVIQIEKVLRSWGYDFDQRYLYTYLEKLSDEGNTFCQMVGLRSFGLRAWFKRVPPQGIRKRNNR